MTLIYSDGTVSVTNGDANVSGTGTAWAVSGIAGGLFSCNGLSVPIASVTDDSTLVLAYVWPGASGAAQIYAIQRENSVAANIVDVYDKLSQVLRQLALAGIHPSAVGTIAERNALTLGVSDKDFIFLYLEIGFDLAFYRWTGTAWQGPFALKGADGPPGQSAPGASGYRFRYSTTTTAADPGSGKLRFNNPTLSSATALYLSETTDQSQGVAAYIAAWFGSGSTIKGTLRLIKELDPSVFAIFNITGSLTDNGTWDTVTVVHLASSGALVDNDLVRIEFVRTGDVGNTGPAAAPIFTYSTTTADADPGSGVFRFDNATLASATKAYVDNLNAGGSDSSAWLDSFDDATSVVKGVLILQCTTTVGVGGAFYVTGTVGNGTGYRKLSLTPIATWGVWANGQTFSWMFTRTGDKGDPVGYRMAFSTTTTDADPGNGIVQANNTTFASVTQLFVDNLDATGATITAFLDSFDDSTTTANRGRLRLSSAADPTIYQEYIVTGVVVDGTGYRKVPVTPVASAGALANGLGIVVTFWRTGDKGADGTGTGDVSGPGVSVADRIAVFNGTTGKLIKDGGALVSDLAPKANATFTGTFDIPANALALSRLVDSAALSVLGRSANSSGPRADIAAGADDTLLRRVSSALGFGQLTAGMVPAGILTYAMLASGAIASNSEFQLGTASKLLSAAALKSTVAYQALTDAATITWDMSLGNNGSVALAGNRTMGNPTNANPLFGFVWKITATTSTRTLDKGTNYVLAAGVESFPISIATTETVFIIGFVDTSSRIVITGVIRT
ncbi:hypothetical protein [Mesorhizobium atlanticum]|uniref:DUF2793 domain-containing protein n=1 Tax=Mesorhizobium atlanticum TaxID=2233532 RepID=A0A330GU24_9HYPH|nr:hypothetical protein [Mesorhizobium atlanticum]RAZ75847.1 hypothetical protein DPM35_13950 [Mesorhizobium atlanticum]